MSDATAELCWVAEARLLLLLNLARSTFQSWVKEGLLELPESGVFGERDVLEVLLASVLRELFPLAEARSLWRSLRQTGAVHEFLDMAQKVASDEDQLDLVVEPATGRVSFASGPDLLLAAVRDDHRARTVHITPLGTRILDARLGFERFSSTAPHPTTRRGRPPVRRAAVRSIGTES